MKDLIEINSEFYNDILNKIFDDKNNLNIINNFNIEKNKVNEIIKTLNIKNYKYTYKDLLPISLLNYNIEQGKKIEGDQNIIISKCKVINIQK